MGVVADRPGLGDLAAEVLGRDVPEPPDRDVEFTLTLRLRLPETYESKRGVRATGPAAAVAAVVAALRRSGLKGSVRCDTGPAVEGCQGQA